MGRYIVLEVEDDDIARALAKKLNTNTAWRVAGLFARPHNWCKCSLSSMGYDGHKNFVRGTKLGWWIHNIAGCGRPRMGTHQLENLLPISKVRNTHPDRIWTVRITGLSVAEMLTSKIQKR